MSQPQSLLDWLNSLHLPPLTPASLLNGQTINSVLAVIVPNHNLTLPTTNTAATRLNNWNTLTYIINYIAHICSNSTSHFLILKKLKY